MPKSYGAEVISVQVRVPVGLVEAMDKYITSTKKYKSRSDFVKSALMNYVDQLDNKLIQADIKQSQRPIPDESH